MSKDKKDRFLKTPHYIGGNAALKIFIAENLQYPEAALKSKTEGTVMLKYDIDYKGNVVSAKVKAGLGNGCDEEAIRLVKLLKFEVPKNRKLRVLFHKTIQIHFRLPKEKPISIHKPAPQPKLPSNEIQYNYVTTTKVSTSKTDKNPVQSYSYTINL